MLLYDISAKRSSLRLDPTFGEGGGGGVGIGEGVRIEPPCRAVKMSPLECATRDPAV